VASLQGYDKLQARFRAISRTEVVVRDIIIHGVAEAKHEVPRKTGNLGRTIRPGRITATSGELLAGGIQRVGYAGWVERGTGVYGPRHRPIVPVKAKVLAWRTAPAGGSLRLTGSSRVKGGKQTAGWAFAKSVRGRPATPYLRPGLQKAVDTAGVQSIVTLWNGAA
jgi:hypothetical protein